MSGIYIKGMKMPEKEQLVIFRIWGNGQVERLEGYRPFLLYGVKATDIPDHGRLIDADAAYNQFLNLMDIQGAINPCQLGTILVDAPTIIPASEDGEV